MREFLLSIHYDYWILPALLISIQYVAQVVPFVAVRP